MYKFYKLKKNFTNGSKEEIVMCEYDPEFYLTEKDFLDEIMEDWGEYTDGGHSNG